MSAPIWRHSPNFGPRRNGARPQLVVLHYTAMDDPAEVLARLCDPSTSVSAHYVIGRDGTTWQLVADADRAWHAGQGGWLGVEDVNSRSLGIELVNTGCEPFSAPQMHALSQLMRVLMTRWSIAPVDVIGHSDMAPERKDDPGPRFDWRRLAREGYALWPEGLGADRPLDASLDRIGYPPGPGAQRLAAFRARFLPAASGPECVEDRRRAEAVATGFCRARGIARPGY